MIVVKWHLPLSSVNYSPTQLQMSLISLNHLRETTKELAHHSCHLLSLALSKAKLFLLIVGHCDLMRKLMFALWLLYFEVVKIDITNIWNREVAYNVWGMILRKNLAGHCRLTEWAVHLHTMVVFNGDTLRQANIFSSISLFMWETSGPHTVSPPRLIHVVHYAYRLRRKTRALRWSLMNRVLSFLVGARAALSAFCLNMLIHKSNRYGHWAVYQKMRMIGG